MGAQSENLLARHAVLVLDQIGVLGDWFGHGLFSRLEKASSRRFAMTLS